MARTAHTLATTKMQLPGKMAGGLPLPQSLSTATSRMASNAQLIEAAKAAAKQPSGLDSIKSALSDFSKQKDNALKQMSDALNGLLGQSATVWVFSGTDDASVLADKMRKIPEPDAIFTLATLFVGNEIHALTRMLNDTDHHPALNGEAIPLKNLAVTPSMMFQDKDQSGQSSSTAVAEQGIKPKELRITGILPFTEHKAFSRLLR